MAKTQFRILESTQAEATHIAQVLANKTAQKILNYLNENSATESELVTKLKLSASTVHYNIKQLKKAHLILEEAMHYSPKGKEVIHYKVTDEHIIISPKRSFNLAEKLQAFVPVFLLVICVSIVMGLFSSTLSATSMMSQDMAQVNAMYDEQAMAKVAAAPMAAEYAEPQKETSDTFSLFTLTIGILIGILLSFLALVVRYVVKKQ